MKYFLWSYILSNPWPFQAKKTNLKIKSMVLIQLHVKSFANMWMFHEKRVLGNFLNFEKVIVYVKLFYNVTLNLPPAGTFTGSEINVLSKIFRYKFL